MVKLDSAGLVQWQNTIGGSLFDRLYSISQTDDEGYICGGWSNSDISGDKSENSQGGTDYWVIKLDSSGVIQWQNTIGGNSDDDLRSVYQISNDGFILGGFSKSDISGDKTENSIGPLTASQYDYWVIKLDHLGDIQWQNTIGGNFSDHLYSTSTDNYDAILLAGYSNSPISGDKSEGSMNYDFWIVKVCNAPTPVISSQGPITFCFGDSVLLSELNNYNTYQWIKSGKTILGANSSNYYAKTTGNFYCIATDQNGCSDTSNSIYVNVPCYPVGPNQQKTTIEFDTYTLEVYPNPTSQNITILGSDGILTISNMKGKTLLEKELTEILNVDLTKYPKGIYFLSLYTSQGVTSKKLILE